MLLATLSEKVLRLRVTSTQAMRIECIVLLPLALRSLSPIVLSTTKEWKPGQPPYMETTPYVWHWKSLEL